MTASKILRIRKLKKRVKHFKNLAIGLQDQLTKLNERMKNFDKGILTPTTRFGSMEIIAYETQRERARHDAAEDTSLYSGMMFVKFKKKLLRRLGMDYHDYPTVFRCSNAENPLHAYTMGMILAESLGLKTKDGGLVIQDRSGKITHYKD